MTIGYGQVSIYDVVSEHGGNYSNASLSNYYRGGASHYVYASQTNIPASGSITLAHFRGTSRMGYYPMNCGYYANANGLGQYGWNRSVGQGALAWNFRYRGYNLLFVIWQTDGSFQICIEGANVPQGTLTNLWTPTYGWVGFNYIPNFFGNTIWNVSVGGTNPFPAGANVEIILQ